ncbi:MAG: hypothetical protein M3P18_19280 [Actinomycetota bacterium]|nr:hypothetical protein [Actinomycetota bacterium]
MANAARERRRRRRIALAVSGPAAALLVSVPAWAGSNPPTIKFSGDLSSGGVFDWTLNRQPKAIASVDCTLNGTPSSCGTQTLSFQASSSCSASACFPSSKSTTFAVTLPVLFGCLGETYVVNVTLADHQKVSNSATIAVTPISACAVVSPSGLFPSGVNM